MKINSIVVCTGIGVYSSDPRGAVGKLYRPAADFDYRPTLYRRALLTLVGLVIKHGILLVEFAKAGRFCNRSRVQQCPFDLLPLI
ncbi:hypothetical protein [Vibrio proteolyticus]